MSLINKDVSDKKWLKDTDQHEHHWNECHKEVSNRFVACITLLLLVVFFILAIPTADAMTTIFIACESLVDQAGEE
jgi:hypothetical protein